VGGIWLLFSFFSFFSFFSKSYIPGFYGTRNDMHLTDMAKTKPKMKQQITKEIIVTGIPQHPQYVSQNSLS